jgi:hypothetical protein
MSVVLPIDLDPRPLHRVPADLVAAPLFATGLPMRGPAASLDWRLCGLAARTAAALGELSVPGRALLAPTRGRMRAAWALFAGAGDPAAFDESAARAWASSVASRATRLRVGALGVALPPDRISRLALDRTITAVVAGTAAAVAALPSAIRLRLIVAAADLSRAEAALAAVPRLYPGEISVRIDRFEPDADEGSARSAGAAPHRPELRSGAPPA